MQTPLRPARAFLSITTQTSCRLSMTTREALERVQASLAEWHLGHADPALRRQGLDITADYALRVVLATFCRDYGIDLNPPRIS